MTTDRALTIVVIIWALLVLLYLAGAGILPADAAPIPGGEDTPMTCGIWTYYAAGVAERAQAIHGVPACAECAGLAVTVDQALRLEEIAARFAAVARVALSRRLLQSISSRPSFSAWRGESVMRPLISPSLVRRMLSGPCSSLRRVILVSWL